MERLNNGAEVIASERTGPGVRVVLALWRGNEYVTWKVGDDGEAYWGRYFMGDVVAATANFAERAGIAVTA